MNVRETIMTAATMESVQTRTDRTSATVPVDTAVMVGNAQVSKKLTFTKIDFKLLLSCTYSEREPTTTSILVIM